MAHPTDPREDAPTEWLSPALYRQLCDAVDNALALPADSRDAVLAARLGDDPRLLVEARALLASYEASPRTAVTTPAAGPQSGTVAIPGTGPAAPDGDGTFEMPAAGWDAQQAGARQSSGTMTLPPPSVHGGVAPPPGGLDGPRSLSRPGPVSTPFAPADTPVLASPALPAVARPTSSHAPLAPVPEPPPPAREVRAVPERPAPPPTAGAAIPVRPASGGRSLAAALGVLAVVVLTVALGGVIWFWLAADQGRRAAEASLALATQRLALSERRFDVVRQLGTRLAEVDNLLAVSEDAGARTARAVLVRTWLQYLQDLQRASGGTDRDLLLDIGRGYRRVAATQGGVGRTLGDFGGAAKTLQIGIRLLEYLDRTARQPDPAILRELTGSQIALGDVLVGARDAAASAEQYRRALATAERLGSLAGNEADARREIDAIHRRLQAPPPAATP